jgi:hypothetical protein
MRSSKNPAKMMIFGEAEVWAFEQVAEKQPRIAELWLDKLEATHWNNYLSKAEADEIAATIVNQNGSRGAHWTYDTFKGAVESLGGKMSEEPYYNCYALWITANMIFSDHAQSIAEDMGQRSPNEVPNEKMALSCYKKAIEKLKDPDRPRFVREYFDV